MSFGADKTTFYAGIMIVILIYFCIIRSRSVQSDAMKGGKQLSRCSGNFANRSLADLPVNSTIASLVGHPQKSTISSVANIDKLTGIDLLNVSNLTPHQNSTLTPISGGGTARILPPVVDPSTYLRTNISVMRNATRDIRGDPEIPLVGPPPAAMPTIGPYQPKLKTLRVNSQICDNTPTPDNTVDFFGPT